MKKIRDKENRFPYRLWFENGEIDELMSDHAEAFCKQIELKEPPIPVDVFVEKYVGVKLKNYEVLNNDILGATYFYKDGTMVIKIDKSLTEQADAEENVGRYNFTVAHEAFHALYHRGLFAQDDSQLEFVGFNRDHQIECLGRDVGMPGTKAVAKASWWEFHANEGAAALLMPKKLFVQHFVMERDSYGIGDNYKLCQQADRLYSVMRYLSEHFGASLEAVRIRLENLGCIVNLDQAELRLGDVESIGEIMKNSK